MKVLGEMSERFKVTISKVVVGETPPWVQIPLSPFFYITKYIVLYNNLKRALLNMNTLNVNYPKFNFGAWERTFIMIKPDAFERN